MIRWRSEVRDQDFLSAFNYLSLRFDKQTADVLVHRLRGAKLTTRRANDILRACDREPLPMDDPGVRRTMDKIMIGKALGPVLVISHDVGGDIADGYHRVSAVYHLDPFADVPLVIAAS